MQQNIREKIFLLATIYYGICGVSAILAPSLWYKLANIEAPTNDLILMVSGPLFCSLAFGAWLARRGAETQKLMAILIITASALDLVVIVIAAIKGELGIPQLVAFIILDLFWCIIPALILKSLAKQGS